MTVDAFAHRRLYSRGVVGWHTASPTPTGDPLAAFDKALWARAGADAVATGGMQHSARSPDTVIRYQARLSDTSALASIGTVEDTSRLRRAESVTGLSKARWTKLEAL